MILPNTAVKLDRFAEVLHHFGLGRTIGFQAAVSDTSGGKHPESSHRLIVRSRCVISHRHISYYISDLCCAYD